MFADGSWALENLKWTDWGTNVAHATGISSASNGIPNQAQGKRIKTKAKVTLWNPGNVLGHRVYRCFALTLPKQVSSMILCLKNSHGWIYLTTNAKPPGTAPCASRQLVISLGTLSAALGHLAVPIRFHDRGGTCSLRGFPRVDGLLARGRVIIRAKPALTGYFGSWSIATITLENGQTASALLEGVDPAFFTRRPRSSRRLLVTPPNASHSVRLRAPYPFADLTIHPVVAGRNGGAT
jgi:hypothetical protein